MVSFETSNGLCSGVSFHIFTTSSDGSDTPHQRLTIMVYSVIKMSSIPFVYDILMDDVSFRIFYGIHGHLITRKLIETPSMDEKLLKVQRRPEVWEDNGRILCITHGKGVICVKALLKGHICKAACHVFQAEKGKETKDGIVRLKVKRQV